MKMKDFLQMMVERQASDLFLRVEGAPRLRIEGRLSIIEHPPVSSEDMWRLTKELLPSEEQRKKLEQDWLKRKSKKKKNWIF